MTEANEANAIPQTVIVDQVGIVQRVFVDGGKQFEEPLRESIKLMLSHRENLQIPLQQSPAMEAGHLGVLGGVGTLT